MRAPSRLRPAPWRWLVPAAAGGVIAGALAKSVAGWSLAAVALPALLAPSLLRANRRAGTIAAVFGVAALAGGMRFESRERALTGPLPVPAPGRVEIEGWIREVRRGSWGSPGADWARLEIEVTSVAPPAASLAAGERLRLSLGRVESAWDIADGVRVRLEPRPPRGFCNGGRDSFARWLRRRGVVWTGWLADDRALERVPVPASPSSLLARVRRRIGEAIDRHAPAGAAGILRALVIGDRGGLSRAQNEAFARSGTAHLLSVSGLHLALVWGAAYALARRAIVRVPGLDRAAWLPAPRLAAPVAVLPAAAYAALTGGEVATLRALVMAAAFLGATVLQRRPRPLLGWAAAGGLLTAIDPDSLGDASFQLSFASVGAILLGLASIERSAWRGWLAPGRASSWPRRALGWLLASLAVSTCASLATAPLTAHHFGLVSLVAVPANLLVGPLLGAAALGLGLVGAAALAVAEPLAAPFFLAAGVLVRTSSSLVEAIARWPWAAISVSPPAMPIALGLLVASAAPLARERRARRVAACGACVLVLAGLASRPPPLRVSFLDVGQGDAALVESADGAWVIDAGGLGGSFDTGAGVVVPALRARGVVALRALVLSHAQRDHYGGLEAVAGQIPAGEFWWNGRRSTAHGFARLEEAVRAAGTRSRTLHAGVAPSRAGGVAEIRVLHPPASSALLSMNDASLALAARLGAFRVLFTGDVESSGERRMVASDADLGASVLKVPHHGSRTSSSHALLRAVRPGLAVASLGHRNRFGFPAREVVERYRAVGAAWVATASGGEIVVESDGQIASVETCRAGEEGASRRSGSAAGEEGGAPQ